MNRTRVPGLKDQYSTTELYPKSLKQVLFFFLNLKRTEGDSNPYPLKKPPKDFKSGALNHSAICQRKNLEKEFLWRGWELNP